MLHADDTGYQVDERCGICAEMKHPTNFQIPSLCIPIRQDSNRESFSTEVRRELFFLTNSFQIGQVHV